MKTAFEHFAAGPPAPSAPQGTTTNPQPPTPGHAYASYVGPWRARFGTPAPFARAMRI